MYKGTNMTYPMRRVSNWYNRFGTPVCAMPSHYAWYKSKWSRVQTLVEHNYLEGCGTCKALGGPQERVCET